VKRNKFLAKLFAALNFWLLLFQDKSNVKKIILSHVSFATFLASRKVDIEILILER